jgi:hypothetical protein
MTDEQRKAAIEHFRVWTVNREAEFADEIPDFARHHAEETGTDPEQVQAVLEQHVRSL